MNKTLVAVAFTSCFVLSHVVAYAMNRRVVNELLDRETNAIREIIERVTTR